MADYNVLTYAIQEVGNETDTPRCIGRAKSVYEYIKDRERGVREANNIEKPKEIPVNEIARSVREDMRNTQRPSLGNENTQPQFSQMEK